MITVHSRPRAEHRRLRLGYSLTIALCAAFAVCCGYHSPKSILPGGARRIQVKPPDVSRTAEPQLSHWIAAELIRGLTREGIPASTHAAAPTFLYTRILSLTTTRSVLGPSGRTLAARVLRIAAEFRLSDHQGNTIWRSGLLELEQHWPLPEANTINAETARLRVLQRLAARTAAEGLELLLSGL